MESNLGSNALEGSIRFGDDGSGSNDFLGYVDGTWKSLTQSGGGSGGADGADGKDGATWLAGSGAPEDANGADGDLYLDTNNGDYYVKASGAWGDMVGNLKGANGADGADGLNGTDGVNGADGADGSNGATWLTGTGAPDDTDGSDGDLYLDTTSGDYYVKTSGAWSSSVGNLTGPQGVAGPEGAPGKDGDAYFSENPDGDISLASANLGLGTETPTVRLDVVGDAKISGALTVDGSLVLSSSLGDIPMYSPTAP